MRMEAKTVDQRRNSGGDGHSTAGESDISRIHSVSVSDWVSVT